VEVLSIKLGGSGVYLEFIVRKVDWLVLSSLELHQSVLPNVTWNKATLFEIDVSSISCASILVVQDGVTLRGKDLFILPV
jgi:hypothetical protein